MPEQMDWTWVAGALVLFAALRGRLIPALIVGAIPFAYAAATAELPREALETVHEFYAFLPYLEPVCLAILLALALTPTD